ncbi:helix-turn-helix transcriptional regulator [Bengtsoniella intestinalis]|uniref:helix-turn-helix domain-containing protein n=1 Tax=Bengtsoniella intestinalis TaxID=3073143 RepID=UPI00391FA3B6
MYEEFFARRVAELRTHKGVSARDMSLSLGLSESYVNKIENGKTFPSMQVFFYICEYFNVSPQEFFEADNTNPAMMVEAMQGLKNLSPTQFANVLGIIKGLSN